MASVLMGTGDPPPLVNVQACAVARVLFFWGGGIKKTGRWMEGECALPVTSFKK